MNDLLDFGITWGLFRVCLASLGHQRVILERFGTTLDSTVAYEADSGSFWCQFGITLGRVGVALASLWRHFAHWGVTLGSL